MDRAGSVRSRRFIAYSVPDGVCNPVRNVLEWKRYGRGCKPRPAIRDQAVKLDLRGDQYP
jgi:hypothetical protein